MLMVSIFADAFEEIGSISLTLPPFTFKFCNDSVAYSRVDVILFELVTFKNDKILKSTVITILQLKQYEETFPFPFLLLRKKCLRLLKEYSDDKSEKKTKQFIYIDCILSYHSTSISFRTNSIHSIVLHKQREGMPGI